MPAGPVFALEWRLHSRRRQLYISRVLFAAVLLFALTIAAYQGNSQSTAKPTIRDSAVLGQQFASTVILTQLALLMLAAPALTAGSICQERQTGHLILVLAIGLRSWEIVLGKFLARMIPAIGLILVSVPIVTLASWFGGIDPEGVSAAFAVLTGTALVTASLGLLLSVAAGRVQDVLMLVYLLIGLALLAAPMVDLANLYSAAGWSSRGLWLTHPFYLIYNLYSQNPTTTSADYGWYLAIAVGMTTVLLLIAVVCLRPVILSTRPAMRGRPPRSRAALLDRDPLFWYELHRRKPSPLARIAWWMYGLFITSLIVACWLPRNGPFGFDEISTMTSLTAVGVGLLFVVISSVTSLSDERTRGCIDLLLTTPVESAAIITTKWRANYRPVWGLILAVILAALPNLLQARTAEVPSDWLQIGRHFLLMVMLTIWTATQAALWDSVGMALAVLVKQPARAITLAVVAYAGLAIGWVFLIVFLNPVKNDLAESLIFASPIYGVAALTALSSFRHGWEVNHVYLRLMMTALMWSIILFLASLTLMAVVRSRFDRSFGRMAQKESPADGPAFADRSGHGGSGIVDRSALE